MKNTLNKPSKKHHYVTKALLARFLDDADKPGYLYAWDPKNNKCFHVKPENIGFETDFNTLLVEDGETDELEKLFSQLENDALSLCRKIDEQKLLVDEYDISIMANFMAMLHVRHPKQRKILGDAIKRTNEILLDITARNSGLNPDDYRIETKFPKGYFPKMEMQAYERAVSLFCVRKWCVICNSSVSNFVTSDSPVVVRAMDESHKIYGIGTPGTEILFPISPRLCIVGRLDDSLPPRLSVKAEVVSQINDNIANNAYRFVIGSKHSIDSTKRRFHEVSR